MKRKIRILIVLFILSFSFKAKAEVLFEIDCNNKNIDANNSTKCEVSVYYEAVEINDIELQYDTNLDVEFKKVDDFDLIKNGNIIKIHANTPLYDEIGFSSTIFEIFLSSNENVNDEESFVLKNIKINNSDTEIVEEVKETFNVTREEKILDSVCTLESIKIDNIIISNFDKNKTDYSLSTDKSMIFIDAVRTSNKSSVEGLGKISIHNKESIVREIKVTAENGDTKIYKINITNTNPLVKEEDVSKDNTLKKLELYYNKEKLEFDFNANKTSYDISVDSNIDKLLIKAETTDLKSTFDKKYGPREVKLKYGINKYEIKVYAENASSKIYTLNIERKDNRDTDNTLRTLKINGKDVVLSDKVDKYEIVLASDIIKTQIEAIANSSKATINYEDINLADGNNDVTVSVIAENGEEKEYHVNIVREEETKVVFDRIEVVGYNINFSKDKHEYYLKIDNDVDKLDIKIIPSDIPYEILNNNNLQQDSKVEIIIKDEENHKYTIFIEKESMLVNLICYGTFAIGLIILSISVIKLKKKHNTK